MRFPKTKAMIAICLAIASNGSQAAPNSQSQQAFIEAAKKALADEMKDPDSVRFRGLVLYRQIESKKLALCGEFNAKNAYGAYVGYRRFYVSENRPPKLEPEDEDKTLFEALQTANCYTKIRAAK